MISADELSERKSLNEFALKNCFNYSQLDSAAQAKSTHGQLPPSLNRSPVAIYQCGEAPLCRLLCCWSLLQSVLMACHSANLGSSKLPNCPASSQPFNWKHKKKLNVMVIPFTMKVAAWGECTDSRALLRFLFFTFVDSHHTRLEKKKKKLRKKLIPEPQRAACTVVRRASKQSENRKFRKATSVFCTVCEVVCEFLEAVSAALTCRIRISRPPSFQCSPFGSCKRTLKKSNKKVFCCAFLQKKILAIH